MIINALLVQFPISLSIQKNLATITKMLDQAEPGDWMLFPEGSVSGYAIDLSFLDSLDHQELYAALDTLQVKAQQRGIFLWVGACTPKDGKWRNEAIVVVPWNWTQFKGFLGGSCGILSLSEPVGELKLCRGQIP